MAMDAHEFWLWKRGNEPDEYEDAQTSEPEQGRFAVADGAAESIFAGTWAKLLVERFAANDGDGSERFETWLPDVQAAWLEDVRGRELPWYAETKVGQGSFATFLGLVIQEEDADTPGCRWQAVAVGDSCLFQTRGDELVCRFPIEESNKFGTAPTLIGSRTPPEMVEEERTRRTQGEAAPGDRFWMMTDALAHWFLSEYEADNQPVAQLRSLWDPPVSDEQFAAWINGLRDADQLRNDDVTLLAVGL